jgi:hypothetical protein
MKYAGIQRQEVSGARSEHTASQKHLSWMRAEQGTRIYQRVAAAMPDLTLPRDGREKLEIDAVAAKRSRRVLEGADLHAGKLATAVKTHDFLSIC